MSKKIVIKIIKVIGRKIISNINAKDVADVIVNYIEEIESKRKNN